MRVRLALDILSIVGDFSGRRLERSPERRRASPSEHPDRRLYRMDPGEAAEAI